MIDPYKRRIHYLRISVTDRCNLRCRYCMPEESFVPLRHQDILTYEEITRVVGVAVPLGIDKIRLTGGEPLVRKDIVDLVAMIASVPGVKDLGLTTNGILLESFAGELAKAGLRRINVSLDTLNRETFHSITRGGKLDRVIEGILAAKTSGLNPIKVNCVIPPSGPGEDARKVEDFCREHGLQIRFIEQMDLSTGQFSVVHGGSGGDCSQCNRLRLTSNGKIKPCLFSDLEYDIREMGIRQALEAAVGMKPEKGSKSQTGCFHNIGG